MIRTLSDRIAVEKLPGVGKLGLLFIPDTTSSTRNQTFCPARVLSAGPKVVQAKAGETIVVSDYFGDEIDLDGKKVHIGRERDIMAVCVAIGMLAQKLQPVGNRVLMVKDEAERMAGDLYLPEDRKAPQFNATIVAVGPDCVVQPDQTVLVPKAQSLVVRYGGNEYLLIEEPALLAIL